MLYNKKFGKLSNSIEVYHGLRLATDLEISKRSGLTNHTNFSLWGNGGMIKPNIYEPINFDLVSYGIGITYTPRMYYSVKEGIKKYHYSNHPTFKIYYSEGFSSWLTNNSKFRKIGSQIFHRISMGYFSNLSYFVDGGMFLGAKSKVHFADYQHFNTSNILLMSKPTSDSFVLLDNYEASTNKYWLQSHVNYKSKYLLIKRLPFFQGKLFDEDLQFKYLYTPNKKHYMEVGYGVNFLSLIGVGIYNSFNSFKSENFGVRVSYNLKDIIN